jgi:hypothetical protein
MAQEFKATVPDRTTNIFQNNIDDRNNENTLRSNFSGEIFPDAPVAGQHCYRTDTGIEYIYDGTEWVEVASKNTIGLDVTAAQGTLNSLTARLSVSHNPDGTLKNPITANVDEFKISNITPTYVGSTKFSVEEDLTGIFTAGRKLKITDGTEVNYMSVVSSEYDTVTNVTVDGTITSSISAVDYSLVQYGLPLASETVKGVVKVGSNISVADGVISVPEASETVKGVVELATPAEVLAGVDTERAVTPAGFKAAFDDLLNIADPVWGSISGTLSDQTDLQAALDGKANASHSHNYAPTSHSHSYAPIPTSSSLPVGVMCMCAYSPPGSGIGYDDIPNGGTVAGSLLYPSSLNSYGSVLTGTWKNIFGATVKRPDTKSYGGLFVRIA